MRRYVQVKKCALGFLVLPVVWCLGAALLAGAKGLEQQRDAELLRAAQEAAQAGRFDAAAQDYQKLVEIQPDSPELWSNLGAVRVMGGHCAEALPALLKARSLNPRLSAPWYFTGFCHLQFHHDEEALASLKRAAELNARDPNAWYLQAQAAANLDRVGTAFEAVVQALSLDPRRPEGYYQAAKTALDLAAACYARVMAAPATSPYPYRLEGERDASQGLWDLAITNYRKAAELAPRDPDVHFALGTVYWRSGKLSEAEAELRRCLALLPTGPWTKLRLAIVLAQENKTAEAQEAIEGINFDWTQSREACEDARVLASQFAERSVEARDLERAIGTCSSRVREGRGGSGADSPPGSPQGGLSARFVAISSYGSGGTIATEFSSAGAYQEGRGRNFLTSEFVSLREYDEFRAAFIREDLLSVGRILAPRVERLPEDPVHAFALGELLHWLSVRYYEYLGTAFPESPAAQVMAAENFASAGETQKAIEIYRGLLERHGNSPDLLRALARVYWTQSRWDEALKVFATLLEVDPGDPTTLVNVARIYSYRQDLENARRHFERAAKIDPKMFEAHLGLGEALRREGNNEGALRELRIASALEPANPRPHYALSQIYRKLDRRQLAQEEMATFQRLEARAAPEKARKLRELVPLD